MRVVSGHQPVYLPWPGLFHKLYLCDVFVYMDTVQYLTGDWNNRNRIRTPEGWMRLTVPVQKSRKKSLIAQKIQTNPGPDHKKFWQRRHWRSLQANYGRAPFFDRYEAELYDMYCRRVWESLVPLCLAQFRLFCGWLGLEREVVLMSEKEFSGRKDELVLDHCRRLGGDAVVFGALGRNYVRPSLFEQAGVRVHFQDYQFPVYRQNFPGFMPGLSVLDLLFNHGPDSLEILLSGNITRDDLAAGRAWT